MDKRRQYVVYFFMAALVLEAIGAEGSRMRGRDVMNWLKRGRRGQPVQLQEATAHDISITR